MTICFLITELQTNSTTPLSLLKDSHKADLYDYLFKNLITLTTLIRCINISAKIPFTEEFFIQTPFVD